MAIVAGFDAHRRQITFDALETETGEVSRGRIDATSAAVVRWARRFSGHEVHVAMEACTGWLFVCDALVAAGGVGRGLHLSLLRDCRWRLVADRRRTAPLRGLPVGDLGAAGTIFASTRTPLVSWFAAVWSVVNQKQGVSALGLQRVLGLGS
jgi:hypothetical protein